MAEKDITSPRWNSTTKFIVILTSLVLIGLTVARFQMLITPLLLAAMLAYLLNPLITFLTGRLHWNRTFAAAVVYLVLLLIVAGLATGLSIYLVEQLASLNLNLQQFIVDLPERIEELTHSQFYLFGFLVDLNRFDFSALYSQITAALQPALAQAGESVGQAMASAAAFFGWALFVLVISFYLAKDLPNFGPLISRFAAGPGYQHDVAQLMRALAEIWDDFLRGQALLAVVIGVVSWIGLTFLGVRYAVALALLAGLLEMVPSIGPVVSGFVAMLVALFQESNWLGLDPITYAIVVVVFFTIVQQLENNFLVPRIIGDSLDLHPVLVMCGAIMGASLAGIPGLLLAAPAVATLRLLARYAWRKLLDQPPFPEEEKLQRKKTGWSLLKLILKRGASPPPRKPPADGEVH